MNDVKVLLAFDHELSLGGTTSFRNNLFEPTEKLLDCSKDIEVPITLFTDVCCALRFREWDRDGFYRTYRGHIERTIDEGHDVQLHLHPHWLNSTYTNGRFIPADTYTLGCFKDEPYPNNITGIVKSGVDFLNEICGRRSRPYRCVAYRAGGFHLSPATSEILHSLYEHGIRIESSIAKGNFFASNLWRVDHSGMPRDANWHISLDGPINQASTSGLYELPIASRPRTPLNNIPFLAKRVLYRHRRMNTCGWPIDVGNTSMPDKLRRMFPRSAWMLGFDNHTHSVNDLMRILSYHLEAHAAADSIACSTVSHPKYMGRYALDLMRGFVERVRKDFGDSLQFSTYQQFYNDVLSKGQTADVAGV